MVFLSLQTSISKPRPTRCPPALTLRVSNNPDKVSFTPTTSVAFDLVTLIASSSHRVGAFVETTHRLVRHCSLSLRVRFDCPIGIWTPTQIGFDWCPMSRPVEFPLPIDY